MYAWLAISMPKKYALYDLSIKPLERVAAGMWQ
jgi:hypothetical protein